MSDRDFVKIKRLRQELNDLIAKKPELAKVQLEIDEALQKAGKNPVNRMAVLQNMINSNKNRLLDHMKKLKKELKIVVNYKKLVDYNGDKQ